MVKLPLVPTNPFSVLIYISLYILSSLSSSESNRLSVPIVCIGAYQSIMHIFWFCSLYFTGMSVYELTRSFVMGHQTVFTYHLVIAYHMSALEVFMFDPGHKNKNLHILSLHTGSKVLHSNRELNRLCVGN